MSYLIEDLLESAKKRSFAPISQSTFSDDGLIEIANDELLLHLVADIMQVREDFFLTTKDVALVAAVKHYGIPERAIGNALKAVFYKDAAGRLSPPLPRTDIDAADIYALETGDPQKFYFEGDEVVPVPTPAASSGYLHMAHYQRPNRLVATSECTKITDRTAGASSMTFTVDTDLSAALAVGDKVDIVSAASPFMLWARDVVIEAITATTIQVALSDVVNEASVVEPQVGDYICAKGTSNIPMLPIEFHMILAQMVACAMLHSLGHTDKLNAAEGRLNKMRVAAGLLVKNRAESSPELLKPRNNILGAFTR
jgi:hypothetical protein